MSNAQGGPLRSNDNGIRHHEGKIIKLKSVVRRTDVIRIREIIFTLMLVVSGLAFFSYIYLWKTTPAIVAGVLLIILLLGESRFKYASSLLRKIETKI